MGECLNGSLMLLCAQEGRHGRFHHECLCEVGDFLFLAGNAADPRWEERLLPFVQSGHFYIIVSQTELLHRRVGEILGHRAVPETRYALSLPEAFDREHLKRLSQALPANTELRLFDEDCYHQALAQEWSRDACSQFASWADYHAHGLGVAALQDGVLIGSASSYTACSKGIEIQVDVRPDHQRRGIAAACSARLILECLDRGLIPEWDAASEASLHLAQKLGYRFAGSYPVWFLNAPTTPAKE